ncbi:VOC family protein [Flexivirga caeni]|uniref:VOC family protein n=1 Tax=Flexivirga caeni TaxID=2294115 RepID=A0A3M9MIN3_9MICO|nr:VOC family protein [Flexivirga caeni]RNI25439.1 VOC family protein [Flexivirga caeni]
MVTRSTPWPAGTPCWVDCSFAPAHRGMHHAQDFYEKLFGWDVRRDQTDEDYLVCRKDDQPVAGLQHQYGGEAPPYWTTYFATEDVEATCAAVTAAGGQVLTEPFDLPGLGRSAYCADSSGAFFGLWQAAGLLGAGLVNEPGAVTWNDLMTRDLEGSKAFYASVFGYTYDDMGDAYVVAKLPTGRTVCGIHQAAQLPDEAPPSWLVHFAVADRDSSAQIAQELGAQILMTMDTAYGPEALLQGKHGEIFSVIALADPPQE